MKIAELEITPEWQDLGTLADIPATEIEVYNAGRSGASQLFITGHGKKRKEGLAP